MANDESPLWHSTFVISSAFVIPFSPGAFASRLYWAGCLHVWAQMRRDIFGAAGQ
jgi:hypothetical protein